MLRPRITDHLILILGCLFLALPMVSLFLTSTQSNSEIGRHGMRFLWGEEGLSVYARILTSPDLFGNGVTAADMLRNSAITATGIATLKTGFSLLAAYALVLFRLPGRDLIFGLMLIPLFFPIETRILPSFLVMNQLGLLNSYAGMILPIVASGLGVLVFRGFLRQMPEELFEAARLDGAGPIRVFFDIVLPLSLPMIAGLFAMLFVLGWNQYLWPLMIATTSEEYYTIVRGIERAGSAGNAGMALGVLATLPPVIVMLAAQRWLLTGLSRSLQ